MQSLVSPQNRSWRLLLGICLLPLFLSSCFFGGRTPDTRYYLLSYLPVVDSTRTPHPYNIRLREFEIAEAYRKPQLVYRQSPHELQYYNYHQWAIKPERLVTEATSAHWAASRVFQSVQTQIQDSEADFILDGMVEAIEEYDHQERWYAHLSLRLSLLSGRDGRKVWTERYDFRTPVETQEPVQVVRALSAILESVNRRALYSVDSLLQNGVKP
jgi:ABC-type uncharacterized transport system auxiliary subunit